MNTCGRASSFRQCSFATWFVVHGHGGESLLGSFSEASLIPGHVVVKISAIKMKFQPKTRNYLKLFLPILLLTFYITLEAFFLSVRITCLY